MGVWPRTWTFASKNPVRALLLSLSHCWQQNLVNCQSLLPGYNGMKWVSSRILFELSGSSSSKQSLFSIVGCCIAATTQTTMVLSCIASSTGMWVNQLVTLVQQLGGCRITTFSNLESLGHLLARIAMSSWRSTERYKDCIFWKRSVSLSVLDVFLYCVCYLAFCFLPVLETTWE